MMSSDKTVPNDLIFETSPYLLQHAHNPVHWKPYTSEVWQLAKKENKLVLVSIGYSACHWCHVMEHESFEDETVATYMNENFICIKVDREERPDVDHIYMEACTIMTNKGGWPLNVFTLPDGRPVYAGTYFPKNSWWGILRELSIGFKKDEGKYVEFANKLEIAIKTGNSGQVSKLKDIDNEANNNNLTNADLTFALENALYGFDRENGGKGRAPKFPMPNIYEWLMMNINTSSGEEVKRILTLTLTKMALGGIYDQIGGGFARYSVDDEWHIPHFEKMLYDNAQLLGLYANAITVLDNPENQTNTLFNDTLEGIYSWLKFQMKSPNGGYYSSIDADSEGIEGKFYVFTSEEIKDCLTESEFQLAKDYFSLDKGSYWEEGNNHLRILIPDNEYCSHHKIEMDQFKQLKSEITNKLFQFRAKRIPPGIDKKIILSWNCLLINGFCSAFENTKNQKYFQEAIDLENYLTSNFILNLDNEHFLVRTFRAEKPIYAFLDDYALYIKSLISLYKITFNEDYLQKARFWLEKSLNDFQKEGDFFYFNQKGNTDLFTSKLDIQDNVVPSANSIMAKNLFLLGKIFSEDDWINSSNGMVKALIPQIKEYATFFSNWAITFQLHLDPFYEVVFHKENELEEGAITKRQLKGNYILLKYKQNSIIPQLNGKSNPGIYVCRNKVCNLPVSKWDEIIFS